jgi:hypothetical protein
VQIKGKRHYLGVWGTPKSKERYARFVAELAANPVPTPPPAHSDDESITIVELCAAFHDFAIGYYRKNGEPTRRVDIIDRVIGIVRDLYGLTVSYTLACLRECGDKAGLDALFHKCQSALKLLRRRIAEGTLLPDAGESMIRNLEEHINNLPAEVELARQRYETFCEKVVKELLP